MLGLDDIVVPGIFIALIIYIASTSLKRGTKYYFCTTTTAYMNGLIIYLNWPSFFSFYSYDDPHIAHLIAYRFKLKNCYCVTPLMLLATAEVLSSSVID